MSWNDEKLETMKKLWSEGVSASQIADKLRDGITRNAVIGKIHRLGLSGRATGSRKSSGGKKGGAAAARKRRREKRIAQGKPPSAVETVFAAEPFVPEADLVVPVAERKTILTLEAGDCRWPIGDPRAEDFHFCGKGKVSGLPYCEFHVRRAYQPPKPASGNPANRLRLVAGNDIGREGGDVASEKEIAASGAVKAKERV